MYQTCRLDYRLLTKTWISLETQVTDQLIPGMDFLSSINVEFCQRERRIGLLIKNGNIKPKTNFNSHQCRRPVVLIWATKLQQ